MVISNNSDIEKFVNTHEIKQGALTETVKDCE